MGRTRPTATTRATGTWGTSSGFGGEDFEGPKDISDVAGIDIGIPRGNQPRAPSLPSSTPAGRSGGGIDLSKPGPAPFEGMEPKRAPGRSPIGLEIGKSAGGGLGVTVAVPIGGPISARGGVNIGADGAIKGAQVGLGVGSGPIGASVDVGVDQDETGRGGCFQYVTVCLGPFCHTFGRNVCEATPTPTPTPAPTPAPAPGGLPPIGIEAPNDNNMYWAIVGEAVSTGTNLNTEGWKVSMPQIGYDEDSKEPITQYRAPISVERTLSSTAYYHVPERRKYRFNKGDSVRLALETVSGQPWDTFRALAALSTEHYNVDTIKWERAPYYDVIQLAFVGTGEQLNIFFAEDRRRAIEIATPRILPGRLYTWSQRYFFSVRLIPFRAAKPVISPPLLNSPPKKNMNDECCKILALYHQEQLRLMGRPLGPQGQLITIPANTYFNTEIERVKTPIENIKEPEKVKIKFENFYDLLMYGLQQQISLDVAIDPQSFVAPTGKLQNPAYQRDSEQSLESNTQPDTDKAGNKRELEIGNEIKINSLTHQQQYIFDGIKRLEYLFPSGELGDAKFKKSLIIPGAEGELKVHNLIHFEEFLIQFLNATLGNPKIPIKIEDTNAVKEGNQSATFNHFSISHMIRELYKLVLESGDDINAIMETTVRDLRTNLANRIQIVQIAEMAQALVEDTGMLEAQEFISLKLEGDPYAGKWKPGMGFEPDAELDSNEEKATEKLLRATLKNFVAQVKVIRRDKRENADIRDLLLQLSEMFIRSTSIPATKEGVEKALAAARYKVRVDNALSRTQVKRAAAAKLSRTKKRNR